MSNAPDRNPERLLEIDALRGIAALCVVFFHLKIMTAHPGGALGLGTAIGRWGNDYLWTAVDLFFLISGFIFAHVYLRDGRLNPKTTLWGYGVARFARIYPLHLLMLLIVAAIVWSNAPLAPSFGHDVLRYDAYHFVLNLLMLQASGINHGFSFNSPAWSLTTESLCYALFYFLARAGGRWVLAGAVLAIAAGFLAEACPALVPIPVRIARGLVGFFVGVLVYRYQEPLRRIPFAVVATLAIASLVAAPLFASSGINAGIMMSLFAWPWVVLTCLHPASAYLLRTAPLRLLGDLSYSIYLIHIPLALVFLTLNGGSYFTITQFLWVIPLYLMTLLVISWISFSRFEEPVRRHIRNLAAPQNRS